MEEVSIVVRWAHLLLGITWISMLYYFNFVQGGYFKANHLASQSANYSGLAPNTMRWFRWVAGATLLIAVYLLWKTNSLFNHYIFVTALMSVCMLLNVFFFIWPAQQISLGFRKGNRAVAAERAILASRTNNLLCFPVCYCLLASMLKGYSPEYMLFSVVSTGTNTALAIAFCIVLTLELNVIFGQQLLKVSMQAMAQSSLALTGVLFFSLAFM